jgi:hypothetical protein
MRKGFFRFALVFSILAGTIPLLCHEWFFDETEVDVTLPENWKRMSTQERLDSLDRLLSRNEAFFLLSKIKQFRIGSQLRKMIVGKEDQVLKDGVKYSLSFRYHVGWVESLNFPTRREPTGLAAVKITLFGFLALGPGSRKPRPLAVDECASSWPGCRPAWAFVRCHGLCQWGSTNGPKGRRNRGRYG